MTRMPDSGRLIVVVFVLLNLAGCTGDNGNSEQKCVIDDDCPYGQLCRQGICKPFGDESDGSSDDGADQAADPAAGDRDGTDGSDPGPQYTACEHNQDCPDGEVCSFLQLSDSVITVCRSPVPGGVNPGYPCLQNADCLTNLCLCDNEFCSGGETGRCSAICDTRADCLRGYMCSVASIPDLSQQNHFVFACVRDQTTCLAHDECPQEMCCRIVIGSDAILTQCASTCQGEPNMGNPCGSHQDCYSGLCFDYPGYCLDLCVFDDDCPGFDAEVACGSDVECDLGYLCIQDSCQRVFTCQTMAFNLGQGIYDTLNMCLPNRVSCQIDGDCRSEEACKIYPNETATQAVLQCEVAGPGSGILGADCTGIGSSACWSSLCLTSPQGSFCSQACLTDSDCEPSDTYRCGWLTVTVREGYTSDVPVCKRR